ncbi:VOC family protein [Haloferula sp. BvORR071]|uniref:VOC family protein n=1 Tax=Haloferula sp. BvORR071 TaxID=1396141 RepID=UPI000698C96B|nr:VOC family protein [Haloferula sp. BvORR071]
MSTTATAAAPITVQKLFVNLPVKDVQASVAFFTALGFSVDPNFCGEGGASISINPQLTAMLLSHEMFRNFAPGGIADTSKVNEVLLTLQLESREQVDEIVRRARAAGGTTHGEPTDHGFMYDHDFIDLDGHGWGVCCMSGTPSQG